jgi:hypothetical protein
VPAHFKPWLDKKLRLHRASDAEANAEFADVPNDV